MGGIDIDGCCYPSFDYALALFLQGSLRLVGGKRKKGTNIEKGRIFCGFVGWE